MEADWIILGLFVAAGVGILLFSGGSPRAAAVARSTPGPSRARRASYAPIGVTTFPLLASSDPFGSAGALVWRTQVPALRTVCAHEPRGISCAELKPIYAELARCYPEIYDGHNFREWGQLLVDLDLLRVVAESVHITSAGRALLDMLEQHSTQLNSPEVAPQWLTRLKDA